MKKTFTGGAVPKTIYAKIHDQNFMTEIYKLVGWYGNNHSGVTRFGWAIISAISWIFMFMFPHEELFLYVPKSLHSWYACTIFYVVLATAALSLTYAAYKFGEGVESGTYILGRLAKFVNYSAFALIALMASRQSDLDRTLFGMLGFMWEFHSLMKLGWNFLDYNFFEMIATDTPCIMVMCLGSLPPSSIIIVMCLVCFVSSGAIKYFFHLRFVDTIEDSHCGVCVLAMERYPEKMVELLEGSVLESVIVSQPKLPSRNDEN